MERIVIYGAGNTGKSAYFYYKNRAECLFFVDSDEKKWGGEIAGLAIKSPSVLQTLKDVKVIIASVFWREILDEIKGIPGLEIVLYEAGSKAMSNVINFTDNIETGLRERTIDLGAFFRKQGEIICKELTFMSGNSLVLDYAFLKVLAEMYDCKTYLEIGTYIGESINILTDCCRKLYSITAPLEAPYSMREWCKKRDIPDYSERLTYSEKITHFFEDSRMFDYSKIDTEIDLFFIDGDHRYEGVYADSKNIFSVKRENAIIVWHDFRDGELRFNEEVICAVKDAIGDEFQKVYVTNCNCCGVYLPEAYIKDFKIKQLKYEDNTRLYTYDVILKNCKII